MEGWRSGRSEAVAVEKLMERKKKTMRITAIIAIAVHFEFP
jgi:hypothetical protein